MNIFFLISLKTFRQNVNDEYPEFCINIKDYSFSSTICTNEPNTTYTVQFYLTKENISFNSIFFN